MFITKWLFLHNTENQSCFKRYDNDFHDHHPKLRRKSFEYVSQSKIPQDSEVGISRDEGAEFIIRDWPGEESFLDLSESRYQW